MLDRNIVDPVLDFVTYVTMYFCGIHMCLPPHVIPTGESSDNSEDDDDFSKNCQELALRVKNDLDMEFLMVSLLLCTP